MLSKTMPLTVSHKINRISVASIFFLSGLCFSSWASRIPGIQQNLGLSDSQLGLVLFALPVGSMISLPFAGFLTAKAGSRKMVIIATFLYSLVLVTLGLSTRVYQLVSGLFLFGLAGNLLNIAMNTQAVGVEALYKRTIMASFHGIWSLAGFIGAAIGTFMMGRNIVPYQHFMLIMITGFTIILLSNRNLLKDETKPDTKQPLFVKPDKSLVNLGIIAFCSMICEGAMFDWSGVYFKKVVVADQAWLGAGYTAFMSMMALGRFIADWATVRFGLKRILQLSGLLIASGLMTAVLFPHIITAILGFLLVGIGVSSVVPLVYSAAGRSKVLSPGVALATVSTIGFLGFLCGPPLIGLVAGASSLRISFSIIALMGFCVTIFSTRSKF